MTARTPKQRPAAQRSFPWRRVIGAGVTALVWAVIALVLLVGFYAIDLPDIDQATQNVRHPSVVLRSPEGEVFASFGDLYGEALDLPDIAPTIPEAVLATEDRRFYSHVGVDPIGLARALFTDLRAGHMVQGGSTITQQLAKNLFLKPEKTLKRKVQELLVALWLERRLSKERILALYLNRVYFGSGTYGVDAAARRYFNVSARKVSLYQAAAIAGLLKAPSRYSPLNNPEAGHKRTLDVLANMVDAGMITTAQADIAAIEGAASLVRRPSPTGRYFADWIMGQVEAIGEVQGQDIVVTTTLDPKLERSAESLLAATIDGPGAKAQVSQGAVVVLSPDGAVRALTGGADYDESQFNRATQALRQPGSAFKPFIYLAAMEQGASPDDTMLDGPIDLGGWQPTNFTGGYEGVVTLRHALAESINTVAVRLIERVGPRRVIALAHRLGITSDLNDNASLALGTSEVKPLDLVTAYAAFANGGEAVAPYGIAEITDRKGAVLWRREGGGLGRVISPPALAKMTELLTGVITDGTGKAAALDRPAAGKTGTTQDYRDAWFLGFTADYVAGVWLGNDDQRHAMRKVTGGSLPAQLWKQVMLAAHRGLPARPLNGGVEGQAETPEGETPASNAGGGIDALIRGLLGR